MQVLVIPDVHLKPWMFSAAAALLSGGEADLAVCLMDLPDDWRQEYNLTLYEETFDAAISFAKTFPDTLWCYGNHDVCYLWNQRESGYSPIAPRLVCEKLGELREALPDPRQLAFIHRIDRVLFMHGGLSEAFLRKYIPMRYWDDPDEIVAQINRFGYTQLWQDESPLWYRPQYYDGAMYAQGDILQVVGHTPVESIAQTGNVISCDVFSTDSGQKPIGTEEFLRIDTRSGFFTGIPGRGIRI